MMDQFNVISLREQVYNHLRHLMAAGDLVPGSPINITRLAKQFGISKTPLRDALIHLEVEGFVTILPRRGVLVNTLDISDVKQAYETVGMVEASIVLDNFEKITLNHIDELEALNRKMISDIKKNDFSRLFKTNLLFHDVYLSLSDNEMLKKFILPIKHRLYVFPPQNYLQEWELSNCKEHQDFISCLKNGNADKAADILKNVHWSFEFQKDFIKKFYHMES